MRRAISGLAKLEKLRVVYFQIFFPARRRVATTTEGYGAPAPPSSARQERGPTPRNIFQAHLENLSEIPEQGRRLRFLNDAIAYACRQSMQQGLLAGWSQGHHPYLMLDK